MAKKSYQVWVRYEMQGRTKYGKTTWFDDPIEAQRYAIKRAKAMKHPDGMVYLTGPEGYSEQYDPGSWR